MGDMRHLIGLLLGTEEDWPRAFETLLARLGPVKDASDTTHHVDRSLHLLAAIGVPLRGRTPSLRVPDAAYAQADALAVAALGPAGGSAGDTTPSVPR